MVPLELSESGIRLLRGQGIETEISYRISSYGTSYTEEQINEALNSVEPLSIVPSVDTIGHGTFMAMVAAGNEVPASNFTGAAPESKLAVVKLKPAKNISGIFIWFLKMRMLTRKMISCWASNIFY